MRPFHRVATSASLVHFSPPAGVGIAGIAVRGAYSPTKLLSPRRVGRQLATRRHISSQPPSYYHANKPLYIHSRQASAQNSAIDPVTVLIAVSVTLGAGYIASTYLASASSAPPALVDHDQPEKSQPIQATSTAAYPDMPASIPPGRPGTLTPEQEQKLKEFWIATLDVFGVATDSADNNSVAPSGTSTPTTTEDGGKPKKRLGIFKSKKDKAATADATSTTDENDKHGQQKEFKEALANTSPEQLRLTFWSMVKHDDPDALLLRFLRARKWDVQAALVMLIATMHWRAEEMHVDDDIMLNGEAYAAKRSATDKDSADFLTQLRMGKSILHGVDKEGRPIVIVRVRLHKAGEQTEKSLERYTVHTIETTRMLLRGEKGIDTATIIFDMSGFSMANMDYTPVKFMIKCFEANYPESLGSVVVYKAPWVFNQIWRIIRGWLDPVVASKIHFAKTIDELDNFVPRDRILKELDGPEDWEYKFIDVQDGENKVMEDKAGQEALESQRKEMVLSYQRDTVAWTHGKGGAQRSTIRDQLRENYWKLDPHIRARSHVDREGLLGPAGELNFYSQSKSAGAPATSATAANDDLD